MQSVWFSFYNAGSVSTYALQGMISMIHDNEVVSKEEEALVLFLGFIFVFLFFFGFIFRSRK